jgi:hypothetical protein
MQNAISGRDIALMAGGIALGVMGGRLLAPLVAMGSGAVRSSRDPFDLLESDHRYLLKTLRKMEEASEAGRGKRTALLLALKRRLAKHALAEEDIVYPLLSDEAQRREAARHLYEEHADMKMLLFEIESAVMRGESWRQPLANLHQMIERHAREEEEEQFPRLRQVLSEKKFKQVAAQVHREEAFVL